MKRNLILATMFAMVTLFTGCNNQELDVAPAMAAGSDMRLSGEPNCQPLLTEFYAGQHTLVGDIVSWNDSSNLYITFTTIGEWEMTETHLYAGSLAGLPTNAKGNPKNGNFPYKMEHVPGTKSYTYTIPLSSLGQDDCIAIAAHSAVVQIGPDGEVLRGETAWGAGTKIASKGNWSTYITYCICRTGSNDGSGTGGDTGGDTGGVEGN